MSTLEGDMRFLARRHDDGRVEIVDAPPTTRVSLDFLTTADPVVVRVSGNLISLAGQVTYRVVGWDAYSSALLVELAEDRRGQS